MTFVQATTGSGGWPMSVWLTPELKPFFGGTYFPPENRWGHPGFGSILDPDRAGVGERSREDRRIGAQRGGAAQEARGSGADPRRRGLRRRPRWKAPSPSSAAPSIRASAASAARPSSRASRCTISCCATTRARRTRKRSTWCCSPCARWPRGGMNDQLGGGFHRYSVDDRWFVPHFEKMLYDQAQIAISYLEAFQVTGDRQYADTARAHLRLRAARHDRCRRRLLLGRRCR